jgi:hypothetical protein
MPDAQGNPTWDDYLVQATDLTKTAVKYIAQDTSTPKPATTTPQTTVATVATNPLMSYLPFMAIGAVLLFVMNKRKK